MATFQIQATGNQSTRIIADGYRVRDGLVEFSVAAEPGRGGEVIFATPSSSLVYVKRLDTAQVDLEKRIADLEHTLSGIRFARPENGKHAELLLVIQEMAREAVERR